MDGNIAIDLRFSCSRSFDFSCKRHLKIGSIFKLVAFFIHGTESALKNYAFKSLKESSHSSY